MKQHVINRERNFIAGWYMENTSICDKIINFFDRFDNKLDGRFATHGKVLIDKSKKDSLETNEWPQELYNEYCRQLGGITEEYKKEYPYCDDCEPWGITSEINIQHYPPGGGFHVWHTERSGVTEPISSRHLVFMTYLNDVAHGGETEFYHQNLRVRPEKGLTLIWPTEWTHYHRGIPAPYEHKYVVTGWYNFLPEGC